ncbi:phage holin family protein [Mitsuokella jalaludinii]|uniref:phage holin family protein n=1 Tax=Mitsuokella jalaludinii TaxID=187979 RepID=UPI003AB4C041
MNDIVLVIKSLIPIRVEAVWGTITGVVGVAAEILFGAWSNALAALVVAMLIDYVSGVIVAYINPALSLNSQRGFRGILKKIMILLLVSLGHVLDTAMHQQIICIAVTYFFLGNEGLSIVENAAKAGVPIPTKLRDQLEQLMEEKEGRDK